ncbi:hypothetical protein ANN_16138 [Periplaneta americana]|uniref:Uncharacterized protein n=1 Tax=Periplaneta americana TaxID=6978 RepID=A0ABQ8SI84_PERAM|nr:hypothetical protein ANN_16138 [Periplaneta americana]
MRARRVELEESAEKKINTKSEDESKRKGREYCGRKPNRELPLIRSLDRGQQHLCVLNRGQVAAKQNHRTESRVPGNAMKGFQLPGDPRNYAVKLTGFLEFGKDATTLPPRGFDGSLSILLNEGCDWLLTGEDKISVTCCLIISAIMVRGKNRQQEESIEDCVKRVFEESWRDPTILAGLANLIKDSIVSELKSALARNTEVIEKLEASLREKDERIASLERKLEDKQDALEQYQRRQSLRIFGIPENNNEDTDQIAIEVAAKVGVNLVVSDIDRSHRVGRQGDRPRPVIVKFVSYRKEENIDCIEVNDLLSAAPHTNDFHFSEFPSTASPPPTPATPNPLPVPSTSALLKSSFSSHPNTLKVAHINSQSLLCHFNEVQSIFSPLSLHAILISETWLKPSLSSSLVSLDNYTLCRNDRIGKRGGGVAMYVRSDLPFKIVYQSSNEVLEHPEYLFIEVGASNKKCLLGVVYKPLNQDS